MSASVHSRKKGRHHLQEFERSWSQNRNSIFVDDLKSLGSTSMSSLGSSSIRSKKSAPGRIRLDPIDRILQNPLSETALDKSNIVIDDGFPDPKTVNKKVHRTEKRLILDLRDIARSLAEGSAEFGRIATRLNCNSPRATGIGSKGGHIAREFKSPGPHNGHNPISAKDAISSPYDDGVHEVELRCYAKEPQNLSHPEWNRQFPVAKLLSPKKFSYGTHIERDTTFKAEIARYKNAGKESSIFDQVQPTIETKIPSFGNSWLTTIGNDNSIPLSEDTNAEDAATEFPPEYFTIPLSDAMVDQKQMYSKETLVAIQFWMQWTSELRVTALAIKHQDLIEIGALKSPPEGISSVVVYVGILLGIAPSWDAVKRSVLKELLALLRALRELEPRSVPLDRLVKASKYFESHVYSVAMAKVNSYHSYSHSVASLFRWVVKFERITQFVLSIEAKRHESLRQLLQAQSISNLGNHIFSPSHLDKYLSTCLKKYLAANSDEWASESENNSIIPSTKDTKSNKSQNKSAHSKQAKLSKIKRNSSDHLLRHMDNATFHSIFSSSLGSSATKFSPSEVDIDEMLSEKLSITPRRVTFDVEKDDEENIVIGLNKLDHITGKRLSTDSNPVLNSLRGSFATEGNARSRFGYMRESQENLLMLKVADIVARSVDGRPQTNDSDEQALHEVRYTRKSPKTVFNLPIKRGETGLQYYNRECKRLKSLEKTNLVTGCIDNEAPETGAVNDKQLISDDFNNTIIVESMPDTFTEIPNIFVNDETIRVLIPSESSELNPSEAAPIKVSGDLHEGLVGEDLVISKLEADDRQEDTYLEATIEIAEEVQQEAVPVKIASLPVILSIDNTMNENIRQEVLFPETSFHSNDLIATAKEDSFSDTIIAKFHITETISFDSVQTNETPCLGILGDQIDVDTGQNEVPTIQAQEADTNKVDEVVDEGSSDLMAYAPSRDDIPSIAMSD